MTTASISSYQEGQLLYIDKPLHWTSFDVVKKLRSAIQRYTGHKVKVGHAGTLDPLATGLLIIGTGRATKQLQRYQDMRKVYTGTLRLGAATPSYDGETAPEATFPYDHLTSVQLRDAARQLTGVRLQQVPHYSAVKVKGKRLYKLARQQKTAKLPVRSVHVYHFALTDIAKPEVHFRIECSKGTYIRTLAHDFGIRLHNGAYLTRLRRIRIGAHHVKEAVAVEDFVKQLNPATK